MQAVDTMASSCRSLVWYKTDSYSEVSQGRMADSDTSSSPRGT